MWAQAQFTFLKPNEGDTHGNPHAIRRGHWTSEAFKLSAQEIAEKHGYLFEKHEVYTADGYILQIYRIRNKKFAHEAAKNTSTQP